MTIYFDGVAANWTRMDAVAKCFALQQMIIDDSLKFQKITFQEIINVIKI